MKEFPLPQFCGEPTADGDIAADWLRQWYEANRESWWARHKPGIIGAGPDRSGAHADNFMLELLGQVHRLKRGKVPC